MTDFSKKHSKLLFVTIALFFCSNFIIQTEAFAEAKIPFKTSSPARLTVQLEDKDGNPVKAKITFWEYKPPFKVDQSLGLKWEDLDFSTIEQVYLGFLLFNTKEQYLNLHQGRKRDFLEKRYKEKNFNDEIEQRNKIPLAERYNVYYSKILIEVDDNKYIIAKSRYKGVGGVGLRLYFFENGSFKDSEQLLNHLDIHDLLVAYQDKDNPQFIQWLKERQIKEESIPAIKWILIFGLIGFILVAIFFIIRKGLFLKSKA